MSRVMEKCDSCKLRYVCEEQAEFECKQRGYSDYSPEIGYVRADSDLEKMRYLLCRSGLMTCDAPTGECTNCLKLAQYLLEKGVKLPVVKVKKEKPPVDLTNKCGSCIYAEPTVAFGGSKCYVKCKHPNRKFETYSQHSAAIKQRTTVACKKYKEVKL